MAFVKVDNTESLLEILESISDSPYSFDLDLFVNSGFTVNFKKINSIDSTISYLLGSDTLKLSLTIIYFCKDKTYNVISKNYKNKRSQYHRINLPSNIDYHYKQGENYGSIASLSFFEDGTAPKLNRPCMLISNSREYICRYPFLNAHLYEYKKKDGKNHYTYPFFGKVLSLDSLADKLCRVSSFNHAQLLNIHNELTTSEIELLEILLHD